MRTIEPRATLRSVFAARHLRPAQKNLVPLLRRRGRDVWPLHRRGADLGFVVAMDRTAKSLDALQQRWNHSEPVFLPGILGNGPSRHERAIRASLAMFERLRAGAPFLDEIERRVSDDPDLRYAGSPRDEGDTREIERVFVDAEPGGVVQATDLWA